jgi:hypothetical protein
MNTMKKRFTPWQLFSLIDGRLSTHSGDLYDMLNHICNENLMTHHLPVAYDFLKLKNPKWFVECKVKLEAIKKEHGNNFETLRDVINKIWVAPIDVPQLKDEFDPFGKPYDDGFATYMVKNSLLNR